MLENEQDVPFQHDTVDGSKELTRLLCDYLEWSRQDQSFANNDHHILYRCGDQASLIRVETRAIPFSLYYCDLSGRPAPRVVKEAVARFLWDRCGEKEKYTNRDDHEMAWQQYLRNLDRNHYFVSAGNMAASLVMAELRPVVSPLSLEKAYLQLQKLKRQLVVTSGVGLFSPPTAALPADESCAASRNRLRR